MKKIMMLGFAVVGCATVAKAQTYQSGSGIAGIDKLGAHQNGGRGCAGCHAPHSGARGNGGSLTGTSVLTSTANTNNATGFASSWSNTVTPAGTYGDTALWGQDIGPILALPTISTGGGKYAVSLTLAQTTQPKILTGIVFCLSCHDGQVAKGAMMTNQSFEQAAGLLPPSYGSQPIPTLLGNDGGVAGNYQNDHPIGQAATVGAAGITNYVMFNSATPPTKVILNTAPPDTNYATFITNYGAPIVNGGGFVVDTTVSSAANAYVVCTTCHNQHSMYVYSSASATNPIGGNTSGNFPTYFFINAPYNPGANTVGGTLASSATQFCRQCHFQDSNEAAGIMNIKTAY